VSVELCPDVIEAGVNDTVAPLGVPLAASVTVWAFPLVTLVLMVVVAVCPAVIVTELGDAVMAKSSVTTAMTVSDTVVVWVADDPVPIMTRVDVPAGVPVDVVTVSVELCPDVIEAGLKDTVAPLGVPLPVSVTAWALPPVTLVLMVVVVVCPAVTDVEDGAELIAKSSEGGGGAEALNRAIPADQYTELLKVPEKLCGPVVDSVCEPLTTVTDALPPVDCCGPTV
jgi:hypothetical protein